MRNKSRTFCGIKLRDINFHNNFDNENKEKISDYVLEENENKLMRTGGGNMLANVDVYAKLRVSTRVFSARKIRSYENGTNFY